MDLQASFGVLSKVIEQYESHGRSVRNVEATAADSGERLRSTLSVPLCLCASTSDDGAGVKPQAAALTDDGLEVDFDVVEPTLPDTDAATVTVTNRSVRVVEAGEVLLAVEVVIESTGTDSTPAVTGTLSPEEHEDSGDDADTTDGSPDSENGAISDPADQTTGTGGSDSTPIDGSTTDGTSTPAGGSTPTDNGDSVGTDDTLGTDDSTGTDELARVRDESVPPYEDEPYLRRLYEVCDTFDEMQREIPMDISAETARRYMIEAGIHDPATYDTANERGDDGAATDDREAATAPTGTESTADPIATIPDEQLVTDGIGLPADLSIADVADAVVEAGTMYEVRERLDLDPSRTRDLLQQLNLIDLVMRRIGDDTTQKVTRETVADRLRERARSEPDAPTAT